MINRPGQQRKPPSPEDEAKQRMRNRVRQFVNKNSSIIDILKKYCDLDVAPGQTFCCPFHADNRKSAKMFPDNAFFCFAEQVQYTPYRALRALEIDTDQFAHMVPPDFMEESEVRDITPLKEGVKAARRQWIQTRDIAMTTNFWQNFLHEQDRK